MRALLDRFRQVGGKTQRELDAHGLAPLSADERAELRKLAGWLRRFNCVAHVKAASEADRERLAEFVEASGGARGTLRSFEQLATDYANALRSRIERARS